MAQSAPALRSHGSCQCSLGTVSIPDAHALPSGNGWEVAQPFPWCSGNKPATILHGPAENTWTYRAATAPAVQKGEEKQKLSSTVLPSPVHTFGISAQEWVKTGITINSSITPLQKYTINLHRFVCVVLLNVTSEKADRRQEWLNFAAQGLRAKVCFRGGTEQLQASPSNTHSPREALCPWAEENFACSPGSQLSCWGVQGGFNQGFFHLPPK